MSKKSILGQLDPFAQKGKFCGRLRIWNRELIKVKNMIMKEGFIILKTANSFRNGLTVITVSWENPTTTNGKAMALKTVTQKVLKSVS